MTSKIVGPLRPTPRGVYQYWDKLTGKSYPCFDVALRADCAYVLLPNRSWLLRRLPTVLADMVLGFVGGCERTALTVHLPFNPDHVAHNPEELVWGYLDGDA